MAAPSGLGVAAAPTASPKQFVPLTERVRNRLHEWKRIGAPPQVLNILKNGYKIPFSSQVKPFKFEPWIPQNDEERTQLRLLRDKLLQQGVLVPATRADFVSRSRLEPKKERGQPAGFRLVVDLRHINEHIEGATCKFETLAQLPMMLQKNDWMVSLDLKSGYYHIPVHPKYIKFLTTEMDGMLVSFRALPFGLSTAPRIFTKVMRVFVGAIRSRGIRVLPYIDDFLLLASSRERAFRQRAFVEELINRLGLTRNVEKGYWEPTQDLIHLGVGIDTSRAIFYVPPWKFATLKGASRNLLVYAKAHRRWVSVRRLANIVGPAMSLYLAVPQVRTYTRSLYDAMAQRKSWTSDVKLSAQAQSDQQFFVDMDQSWNSLAIWKPEPTATIHTDASSYGWGAALNQVVPARGFFDQAQLEHHIAEKELRAVWLSLQYFNKFVQDAICLNLVTDNQVVKSVVNKGVSKSHQLMPLIRNIQHYCKINNLTIVARYIPSEENILADQLSRQCDKSDWSITAKFFQQVQDRWGKRTIDRFATSSNALCQRFNTWRPEPSSLGDSLHQSWLQGNNWIHPPWSLLPQVVRKLRDEPVEAVILAPHWPMASWYPELINMSDDVWVLDPDEVRGVVVATNPALPEPLHNKYWRLMAVHMPVHPRQ